MTASCDIASVACRELSLQRHGQRVLDNVTCAFHPGELTAVVGPNGAGKSSLLQLLAGVLDASAGAVSINEQPLAEFSAAARARLCAYLPQSELPAWSVTGADLVALGLLPWGRVSDRNERIHAALERVDGSDFAARAVTRLSGGELRRVQLARLLVGEAPLLIADEPTAALDIRHQLQLLQTLRGIADNGKTVVLALHDLSLAARFCDRVILLDAGRLRAQGTPRDVFTPAMIGEVYGVTCEFRWRDGEPEFVVFDLI
ncbi:Hemin import ATP-binding protein HmuV [Microbulbifer aggregans]|uniref:Hemin import ATP-binding protein HmuV n=1 Tax=Microbulbifer aggregans TaxID=1769779 RepID=A0A1C9W3U0_9GAMM|nr:ABC transporter ATP-binding protein [Microbulbifer aggregans]AOS95810.1 Hemin import ATP-binding protein HmuV [Microbulbifer aggregans]